MKVVFLKKKKIDLGSQSVTEWTLLEYKKWFSLKVFHFHKGEGLQDRFHTHAFNAVSVLLKGNYIEEVIDTTDNEIVKLPRNRSRFLFIPRDSFHRITKSSGCITILLTGPWSGDFKELTYVGDLPDSGKELYRETVCGDQRVVKQSKGNWLLRYRKE